MGKSKNANEKLKVAKEKYTKGVGTEEPKGLRGVALRLSGPRWS